MEIYLLIAAGIIAALELTVIIMLAVRGGDRGTRDDLRRLEKYVGDEFSRNRKETADSLRDMNALIREMQTLNARQSERISGVLADSVARLQASNERKLDQWRAEALKKLRKEC